MKKTEPYQRLPGQHPPGRAPPTGYARTVAGQGASAVIGITSPPEIRISLPDLYQG